MTRRSATWWLGIAALILLVPTFSAAQHADGRRGCRDRDRDNGQNRLTYHDGNRDWDDHDGGGKCREVPDGGSGALYLLSVGAGCLGAALVRSRLAKS